MLLLTIACVGRAKDGAERDLTSRYLDRASVAGRSAGIAVDLREIDESRARRPDDRKAEEAKALLSVIGPQAQFMALDETGQAMNSVRFASLVGVARDEGVSTLALVIGGPDGLDLEFRRKAAHTIAFGAMTWPHQLVRIMASEQLYRAVTILSGHPYHRA